MSNSFLLEAKKNKDTLRKQAEGDLATFIKLVHPDRVLGHVHEDLITWWNRPNAKSHQLVLLPRDHQKSALLAYRVAWEITRNPSVRILYISATSNLAEKQLYFIKNILTSKTYTSFWPHMVNERKSEREKWSASEIYVDHPDRAEQNVRDPTIFCAGLTTTITGLHFDIVCVDDVVVDDNAKTPEGRRDVKEKMSYMASILGTEGRLWAVGTRYHPEDLYQTYLSTVYEIYDDEGAPIDQEYLFEVYERQVEDRGDGTGNFLWPRMQRADGKWFGFDAKILAIKKAQYYDLAKFRAQYYNNPNSTEDSVLKKEMFQYYDKKYLTQSNGFWYFKDKRLNLAAAIDLAFSRRKDADYTALVVAGIDTYHNVYILDIERFKSDSLQEYFDRILRLYTKWNFRKLRAEVGANAQGAIVKNLKDLYIRPNGLALAIDEQPAPRNKSKEEKIEAALYPRYMNQQVFHFKGGNCELLEEELTQLKPSHDDIKDAFAMLNDLLIPPSNMVERTTSKHTNSNVIYGRFG